MARATCPPVVVLRMRSADSTSGGLGLSSRSERNGKALTCLIIWSVALVGLFAAFVALSPAAQAGTCDQVGGVITGDWTITTAQVCTGTGKPYTVGATIDITGSRITGFSSTELFGLGVSQDDNDDSPLISWASTTASLYGSRIERIYENASAPSGNATGPVEGNLGLTATSNLFAYDTYIGVDFSNVLGLHNTLQVDGTSNAYLYNVTIDRTQDPVLKSSWRPAHVPQAPGGNVFLLRWLRASVVDSTRVSVSGASIWSALHTRTTTAPYPDKGSSPA